MKILKHLIISIIFLFLLSSGNAQKYQRLSDYPEHVKKTKPFKRYQWDFQKRAYPYDTIPYNYSRKVVDNELVRIRSARNTSLIDWISIGPAGFAGELSMNNWGEVSGRIRTIAIHPTDPTTIYIGAASGGLWKTENGGAIWMDIGRELECMTYGAIAIDSSNPEVVYAGSGEAQYLMGETGSPVFSGRGLYKSFDGGDSWTEITDDFGDYTHFSDIAISPHDPDVLLAALAHGDPNIATILENEGVWKSTDAGVTWTKTLDQPLACNVHFHPADPNIAFASIGGQTSESGFHVSNDAGDSWNISNNGIANPEAISRMLFDVSLSNPDILYAVAYEPDDGNLWYETYTNAYKSENGGTSWEQISETQQLGGDWGGWYDQGFYDLCIAVDPMDSDHAYIGNVEIFEAINGEDYNPLRPYGSGAGGSLVHPDYHTLVYAPSDPNIMYIGCDGGIYRYDQLEGTAYSINMGLATMQFYSMGSHPTDPDIMIGGLQDNGTVMTHDGGETWTQVLDGDGMECFIDQDNPNFVYASHYNGYLRRSQNGGTNFDNLIGMHGAWVTPFFEDTEDATKLYSANDDVYTGSFGSMAQVTQDLSPVLIVAMAQSTANPQHMILAGCDQKLYGVSTGLDTIPVLVSTDRGENWTNVTENIPGEKRWISRVIADPIDENTMYIVRCGYSAGNKIYKTTDLGESWTNISGNLADIPCNTIFIDPNNTHNIYIGTDLGVYFSEDGGETYIHAGGDMPLVPIMDFDYFENEGVEILRVATYGRSIYQTTLSTGTDEIRLPSLTNIRIVPNPLESHTTINYELRKKSLVRISIYNTQGQLIEESIKEQLTGQQQFYWSATGLPAGMYYFRIQAGESIIPGKMIIGR